MTRPLALVLMLAVMPAFASENCDRKPTVQPGDTLASLADYYFADTNYGYAILIAINRRAGQEGFRYIGDPFHLPPGATLCIPGLDEAHRLKNRNQTYARAVDAMSLPQPWEVSDKLLSVDPHKPVTVVSWMRPDEVERLKSGTQWIAQSPADLWITIAPQVRNFCKQFRAEHGDDPEQLDLRLEQRLGMPPASGKRFFVEIVIADPSSRANLFRPCAVPDVNSTACPIGPPPASVDATHRRWFYTQYYRSYGQARPSPYPWTSLGYTFDWAPRAREIGDMEFIKHGESEFVVPKGATIEVKSVTRTPDYCR